MAKIFSDFLVTKARRQDFPPKPASPAALNRLLTETGAR
ncbi:MAG: hypothetical protein ACI9JL_000621 [Paracoccaceae bacterium]|jgi:hypothetical protein